VLRHLRRQEEEKVERRTAELERTQVEHRDMLRELSKACHLAGLFPPKSLEEEEQE
jgi:hypothetical protein